MPAGDAQRAWFPEMLEDLKSHWSSDMTWEELAVFCRDMTEKRQRIKSLLTMVHPQHKLRSGSPAVSKSQRFPGCLIIAADYGISPWAFKARTA